jgi:hypothetical protein
VTLSGDAKVAVWLQSASGRYNVANGPVPAGSYRVFAYFDADHPTQTGELVLSPGQRVALKCVADLRVCR